MRWLGGLIAICLICLVGLGACSDDVTNTVVLSELLGGKLANVTGSLPRTRAEVIGRLAEYGYKADDPTRCVGDKGIICAGVQAPDIEHPATATERLYFFKRVSGPDSGNTYGVVVDLDASGIILKAVGFTSFYWVS